jgi:CheY-like chemotaxis protein
MELRKQHRPTILVIDEDHYLGRSIARAAEVRGLATRALFDASRAVETAVDEQPDLILLELQIAGWDGSEILRELKREPRTRGIPVFICTGGHTPSDRLLALELGADEYFEKPVQVELLIGRIVDQIAKVSSLPSEPTGLEESDPYCDAMINGPSDTIRVAVPATAIGSVSRCESCRSSAETLPLMHTHTAQIAWVCSACRSALSCCWEEASSQPQGPSAVDQRQVEIFRAGVRNKPNQRKRRATSERGPRRILVVEDDNDIRRSVCEILQDEGFTTWSARNGREALDLLHEQRSAPSLILLDLMMPVMDGWQLYERLSHDATFHPIPVVIMSAHMRDARLPSLNWLQKPVKLDRLLSAVGDATAA